MVASDVTYTCTVLGHHCIINDKSTETGDSPLDSLVRRTVASDLYICAVN